MLLEGAINALNKYPLVTVAVAALLFYRYWGFIRECLSCSKGTERLRANLMQRCWSLFALKSVSCQGLFNCPCCPRRLRDSDPLRLAGQSCGTEPMTFQLSGILVGDLPTDSEIFLSIECPGYPTVNTSVASAGNKVSEISDTIKLKARTSVLDPPIRIVVRSHQLQLPSVLPKELSFAAVADALLSPKEEQASYVSEDVAELLLRAEQLCVMADRGGHVRIAMHALVDISDLSLNVAPWIFFQVASVAEGESGVYRVQDPQMTREHFESAFKSTFLLMDSKCNVRNEPDIGVLGRVQYFQAAFDCCNGVLNAMLLVCAIVWLWYSTVVKSCWSQYRVLTMAKLNNVMFPASTKDLHDINKKCQEQIGGTGIAEGIPCLPSPFQINKTCVSLPPEQPVPRAGGDVLTNLGINVPLFQVDCSTVNACEMYPREEEFTQQVLAGGILVLFFSVLMRSMQRQFVQRYVTRHAQTDAEQLKRLLSPAGGADDGGVRSGGWSDGGR
eukprot:TRINITY_DN14212_c0_g1_i1.p1 TRINITY_DN14212_c0_g1~~TRINITY_DN14212_c0_g1_i1.p1  ORF type:complete len:501 (-),score=49.20 TRINITY_DN14212_c0_g1_i1:88-1590(-)